MNPDPVLASEALRMGASDYLLKSSEGEELLIVLRFLQSAGSPSPATGGLL
jgi:DNA-binding response OmpR family regulator